MSQLYLSVLCLNFFFKSLRLVPVLLVRLFERFYGLFLELKLHLDSFELLLLGFIPLDVSRLRILISIPLVAQSFKLGCRLVQVLLRRLELQLERVVGTCLSGDLVVTPLDLLVRVQVALIQLAVSIFQLADLAIGEILKNICCIVAEDILSPVVPGLGQEPFVQGKLLITCCLVLVLLDPDDGLVLFVRCQIACVVFVCGAKSH